MGNEFDSGNRDEANSLSVDFIKAAVKQYRTSQLQCTADNLGMADAHSIWFDLPKLKKFIADIENLASSSDPSVREEDLGIRMYYAAYPDHFPGADIKEEYLKKHTLIMVPTKKQEQSEGRFVHRDYNPLENSSERRLALATGNAMAQNHGSLAPPDSCVGELY
ncbi:hypothetical protein ASG31_00575 [Chryseobacterium sp. Leaf404]|uniref:hypothetical protein n=1 Tax=unclassified Chryseobacterium TaxID=2593645 RepID=UPI0006FBADA5|nr:MULTISPECIES: hypothetical protein [unclassified Chryseobacterium]KQT21873.1 hypothetical protein ASG31_00575 [Chryseobacterium sp. Leaf404]